MVNLMLDANKALKKGRHIVEDEEEPKSGISRSQISEDQQKLKPLSETVFFFKTFKKLIEILLIEFNIWSRRTPLQCLT